MRPHALGLVVASRGRIAFVDRSLAGDNQPGLRIGDGVASTDPRLALKATEVPTAPVVRRELAARPDTEVDVVHRAGFVTRGQIVRAHALREAVARRDPDLDLSFADDLLLSVAARDRPRVHDVGAFLDCPTQGLPGVAVFTRPGTGPCRLRAMRGLRAAAAGLSLGA